MDWRNLLPPLQNEVRELWLRNTEAHNLYSKESNTGCRMWLFSFFKLVPLKPLPCCSQRGSTVCSSENSSVVHIQPTTWTASALRLRACQEVAEYGVSVACVFILHWMIMRKNWTSWYLFFFFFSFHWLIFLKYYWNIIYSLDFYFWKNRFGITFCIIPTKYNYKSRPWYVEQI